MKFAQCILTAAAALSALAHAETIEEKGKRLIGETLEALGGKTFLAVTDRVESGRAYSFYNDRLTGLSRAKIYTRYLMQPSPKGLAVREKQSFGKDEDTSVLFNEQGEGWELTFRGARPIAPDRLARYEDSTVRNIFYLLRHRLNEPGLIFESRGSEVLVNIPVEKVDITDSQNRVMTVYLHYSTKLPVRQIFIRRDADKVRHEEVTWFDKYRDVGGGVKWPFVQRRERDGEKVYELFAESVQVNKGLLDDLFALPVGTKELKR